PTMSPRVGWRSAKLAADLGKHHAVDLPSKLVMRVRFSSPALLFPPANRSVVQACRDWIRSRPRRPAQHDGTPASLRRVKSRASAMFEYARTCRKSDVARVAKSTLPRPGKVRPTAQQPD